MTVYFTTAKGINAACSDAYQAALATAEGPCTRSRGRFIKTYDDQGELIDGECDSWVWTGSYKQLLDLTGLWMNNNRVACIKITGGVDSAATVHDFAEGDYIPWDAEWEVILADRRCSRHITVA